MRGVEDSGSNNEMLFMYFDQIPTGIRGQYGNTDNVEVVLGYSAKFSKSEIESAVEAVLEKFKDFEGCNLIKTWYNEGMSDIEVDSYLAGGRGSVNGAKKENVIVLYSDFYVDSSGGDGSFTPSVIYTDWNWILIRDNDYDNWRIDDWGY